MQEQPKPQSLQAIEVNGDEGEPRLRVEATVDTDAGVSTAAPRKAPGSRGGVRRRPVAVLATALAVALAGGVATAIALSVAGSETPPSTTPGFDSDEPVLDWNISTKVILRPMEIRTFLLTVQPVGNDGAFLV